MLCSMQTAPAPAPLDAELEPTPRATRSGFVLAVLVLLASTLLVVLAWRAARERELKAAHTEFRASCQEIVELVQQRLVNYELTIRGGAALFASVTRPSPRQWQAYVDGLDLPERFPAMTGLGYAAYVDPHTLMQLQLDARAAGRGLFTVWPHGVREHYAPIFYLEPKTAENLNVVGYDMYSEAVRHASMEAAMRDATPRMTGRVHLLQDLDPNAAGFLVLAPVFRGGQAPATYAERYDALSGWVYAPVRVPRFVETALRPIQRNVAFRILDVTGGAHTTLFTDPDYALRTEPTFRYEQRASAYGRTWQYEFASAPQEVAAPGLRPLRTALVVGLLASLLLFFIAWTLAYTEARAQRLAARMTVAHRRSEARVRALNRTLEARVETRTRELSEANRGLETFAYSISHDLRAPLRAIEGFGRVLGDRYAPVLDETGRDYLVRIRGAAARMSELIEALLKVSRVGRGDLQPEPLDLSKMAHEIIAELHAIEPHRRVFVDIAPHLSARGDRALVRSLLQNLLGNAWKFTREKEDARIEFGVEADGFSFYVSDNGMGFDPAYADKLFRPFQRLHDDAAFAGEGIGLATAKRIVERHGGALFASGRPGEGAVFSFTLAPHPDAEPDRRRAPR
jgi:signal transduction histidine kinase